MGRTEVFRVTNKNAFIKNVKQELKEINRRGMRSSVVWLLGCLIKRVFFRELYWYLLSNQTPCAYYFKIKVCWIVQSVYTRIGLWELPKGNRCPFKAFRMLRPNNGNSCSAIAIKELGYPVMHALHDYMRVLSKKDSHVWDELVPSKRLVVLLPRIMTDVFKAQLRVYYPAKSPAIY